MSTAGRVRRAAGFSSVRGACVCDLLAGVIGARYRLHALSRLPPPPRLTLLYLAERVARHAIIANPCRRRRKYFSSLERLQIHQQQQQQQSLIEEPLSGRSSRASSLTTFRPSLSLGCRHRRYKSEKTVLFADLSDADIHFFYSLPEKIRKQHFSPEEQIRFQAHGSQSALIDDQASERARQRFADFHFDFPAAPDQEPARGRSRRRSTSPASLTSPSRPVLCLPIRKEKDSGGRSRQLNLDMLSTPVFTTKEAPRRNVRRAMSLTSTPTRLPSASLADGPLSPVFNIGARPIHQRAHSSSLSGPRSSHAVTSPTFDPEATHYQDPEARKKLRMYLASPQKFDEAIEFGFPSMADGDVPVPHYQLPRIGNHSRKFSRDMQTFLRGGKLSFFDDRGNENQGLDSDSDSVADMESPTTPSSARHSFHLHSRQLSRRGLSMDSTAISPSGNGHGQGQMNREMTLRMTLTRPDLRAEEDQLYGWQSSGSPRSMRDDPLALEDLILTDDMTGSKGPFYIKPKSRDSLVTRFLKRASLKTR